MRAPVSRLSTPSSSIFANGRLRTKARSAAPVHVPKRSRTPGQTNESPHVAGTTTTPHESSSARKKIQLKSAPPTRWSSAASLPTASLRLAERLLESHHLAAHCVRDLLRIRGRREIRAQGVELRP